MSDRDAHRFDQLSDGHLADKAAYGDSGAFVALADRFHDPVWTVAALAAADEGTATRATARAFTRTLAGVAAGIGDPDACIERALVTAAFELAVTARVDEADLVEQLPPALRAVDPATRVALWLTTARGWDETDALAAVVDDVDAPPPALDTVPATARDAVAAVALEPPAGLAAATADAWHEWQGIGLTIPERHPLTAVLSRLDAPLGRMGDALGRAGSRTTRRRRARAVEAPAPPPAVLLPVGAEADEAAATTSRATTTATPAAPTPVAPEPAAADETPEPVPPAPDRDAELAAASGAFLGPRTEGLDLPERRRAGTGRRPAARHVATAGATPTRTRVLAALAAGILTASAMGSLLTTPPTDAPGPRSDEIAAAAPGGDARGQGDLLEDGAVPAAAVSDADTDEGPAAPTGDGPGARPTSAPAGGATPTSSTSRDTPRASGSTGGARTSGAPTANAPSAGVTPSGGSTGSGGGTAGGGTAPTTSPAPPATTTPPPPETTSPPPTTTTPPPPTTTPPPTTQPPGPVCTVLPILCPGGGLIP
ncbi:MAG TPA: hypothetical protein VFU19_02285 [Iamia sp.]|nr:hypothetical protein [Iamia sp.]